MLETSLDKYQNPELLSKGVYLKECEEAEKNDLYEIFHKIVEEDNSYIQSLPFTYNDFLNYFFHPAGKVMICKKEGEVLGGYYLKPNFPGKGSHIANCGYIVKKSSRGLGLGEFLGKSSIGLAKDLGYKAIIFNVVFKENIPAVNLWKKLGFTIIGTIPNAIKISKDKFQDGLIMFQEL